MIPDYILIKGKGTFKKLDGDSHSWLKARLPVLVENFPWWLMMSAEGPHNKMLLSCNLFHNTFEEHDNHVEFPQTND